MRLARTLAIPTASALLAAFLLATGAAAKPALAGCAAGGGKQISFTRSYRFALHVGMPEKMYTPAQVRKMHPKSGEVMLRGKMGGMKMGGAMRHLEVQICSRKTRAVVTNANPTIVVVDETAHGMAMKVPAAVMKGVGEGIADLHYGNNVSMPAGHRFRVTVRLKGQRVVFHVTSPKMMSM